MSVETFVEDAGLFYERLGLSRTAGRVMGWLLAAETGDADAPELAEALAVAKSSMSVALRQLEQAGLVERFRVRGGRRDRYRLVEDVFARAFRARLTEFDGFRALAEQGLKAVGEDPERRRRLELMRDMYTWPSRAAWSSHRSTTRCSPFRTPSGGRAPLGSVPPAAK
ncbi:GbsR/MarR family transcriptional regulator [Nonomuraea bangladeshensis]|uniref:GbsR/MarR family transcriptional regulator n=1 Tax=Nonomuraea bangladeshensis TaxID=404385 RepID=UPI003C2BD73D